MTNRHLSCQVSLLLTVISIPLDNQTGFTYLILFPNNSSPDNS